MELHRSGAITPLSTKTAKWLTEAVQDHTEGDRAVGLRL